MAAHDPLVDQHEAKQPPCWGPRFQRPPADELARLFKRNRPRQPRFLGRNRLVHVLAVEVHSGFKPQRVARAQSRGRNTLGEQRAPHGGRLIPRQHDLEPVFAGITRAADEHRADFGGLKLGKLRGCRSNGGNRVPRLLSRVRPLYRENREIAARLDSQRCRFEMRFKPRAVPFCSARVHHQPEMLIAPPVGNQVLENATRLVQQA